MKVINKHNWRLVLTVVTLVALALLVVAARQQIVDTFLNISRVNAWTLSLMLVWQWLDYHAYAKMYQHLYRVLHERIRYRSLYRVSLELNFISHIFPSGGVSGISYFALRMRDAEVTASKSTVVQLTKFILIFVSFQILLGVGLISLALGGSVNSFTILVAGSLFTLLLVGTIGIGFIISSKQRINSFFVYVTRLLNGLIHIFRPQYPETINIMKARRAFDDLHHNYKTLMKDYRALKVPFVYGLLCNVAEILTIYTVYMAFGHFVNPGAIILAYGVASFAGLVSVLPGGVGIFEALMTAVLAAAGVPPGVSIPATVMYRILSTLIQIPPGYYFYYRALHQSQPEP